MPNELVVIEKQLTTLAPRFDNMLRGSLMDSRALIAGVMIACERTPRLLECTPQSLLNCTNTAAALRLPFDGASGQFFPLPFKDKGTMKAQPCVGYKGFNTIGARGGLSINAGVVREGDLEWDYREGSDGFVRHKKKLDNDGRIIASWSVGSSNGRPDVVCVMGIGQIEAIMKRSPAVRFGADSPWKDLIIGFEAMAEKTPRRRLARSIPWEIDSGRFMQAARLDEAFDEQGLHGYIGDKGLVVEGDNSPLADRELNETPTAEILMAPRAIPDGLDAVQKDGHIAAAEGMNSLRIWFFDLAPPIQKKIKPYLDGTLKKEAEDFDRQQAALAPTDF